MISPPILKNKGNKLKVSVVANPIQSKKVYQLKKRRIKNNWSQNPLAVGNTGNILFTWRWSGRTLARKNLSLHLNSSCLGEVYLKSEPTIKK